MKYTLIILIALLFAGCTGFDFNKAYDLSRKAADLIRQQKYAELEEIYSQDFKNSETAAQKEQKYKMIMEAVGEIQSVELVDSSASPLNQNGEAEYKYRFKCSNLNVITSIIVIEDFGDYLVSSISIQQE